MAAEGSRAEDVAGLLDLNDDCLLEIFSHLTIGDTLHTIGALSRRLDAIAYSRIARLKRLDISLRHGPDYTADELQIIGRHLRSVSITAGYSLPQDKVLCILRPLCAVGVAVHLQQLTLNYVKFSAGYLGALEQVAPQLHELDLSFCLLTDDLLAALLTKCAKLRALKVVGNYTLQGESLQRLSAPTLRALEVEIHEQWAVNMADLAARYPRAVITAHNKGRATRSIYTQEAKH